MFDSSLVVQSAASSFNNVAIAAPYFFWSALFMLPIFALVYFFGNQFLDKISFNNFNSPKVRTFNFALVFEIITALWLILMHGNYDALRDNMSMLPYIIAGILFIMTVSIFQKLKAINPSVPKFWAKIKRKKLVLTLCAIATAAVIGFSGAPTWIGASIQIVAVFSGAIVGVRWKRGISPIFITTIIILVITALILMQPEFFRFGQLGNLTLVHLVSIIITLVLAAAVLTFRNINARGKVHHSAFVKLKWMARIFAGLFLILFLFTESILVFIALFIAIIGMFAISVWHEKNVPENLSKKMWALLLCAFGIVISLPVITAIGIIYFVNLPKSDMAKQSKFLL